MEKGTINGVKELVRLNNEVINCKAAYDSISESRPTPCAPESEKAKDVKRKISKLEKIRITPYYDFFDFSPLWFLIYLGIALVIGVALLFLFDYLKWSGVNLSIFIWCDVALMVVALAISVGSRFIGDYLDDDPKSCLLKIGLLTFSVAILISAWGATMTGSAYDGFGGFWDVFWFIIVIIIFAIIAIIVIAVLNLISIGIVYLAPRFIIILTSSRLNKLRREYRALRDKDMEGYKNTKGYESYVEEYNEWSKMLNSSYNAWVEADYTFKNQNWMGEDFGKANTVLYLYNSYRAKSYTEALNIIDRDRQFANLRAEYREQANQMQRAIAEQSRVIREEGQKTRDAINSLDVNPVVNVENKTNVNVEIK